MATIQQTGESLRQHATMDVVNVNAAFMVSLGIADVA